jgi:hypothetical protein
MYDDGAAGLYRWMWRVRRDLLAHEWLSRNGWNWDALSDLLQDRDPLSPNESHRRTVWKVNKLLSELGKDTLPPGDPGEVPTPPYE